MVPWSHRKSRREVGCASPSSLPPRGDEGSPPCGLPRQRCELRALCWCAGSQEMEGFPVWSLLALTTVVLAACRCSSTATAAEEGIGNGVVSLVCCQCFAADHNQQKGKGISATDPSRGTPRALGQKDTPVMQRHKNCSHKRSPGSFPRENIEQLLSKSSYISARLSSLPRGNRASCRARENPSGFGLRRTSKGKPNKLTNQLLVKSLHCLVGWGFFNLC